MKRFDNMILTRCILLCMVFISFTACNKDKDVLEKNIEEIEEYIADNNLTGVQKTESGLHYIVQKEGDGNFPNINSRVKVNYTGYLKDNSSFDAGNNVEFPLSGVIEGWQEGIPKFSRGGSGILLIPSKLAYGSSGSRGIPGNAILIFEVDLIDF